MGPRSYDRGIGSDALPLIGSLGFNGAAILRSRNYIDRDCDGYGRGKLQWGRDLTIAELAIQREVAAKEQALQWGRDLTIAEFVSPFVALATRS